ncbi:hypothetical protein AXG93_473s1210 [Marchantia polymorpha subsp. ruderalis]|uniref:Uncharacterized protein n=1 Tax=Marchantia polymorpha subsp. ruderalis TaxID=1480154 RepID=A0A176W2J0_MARPO|nr:hypothetical protein AXG93_473s1210 [Marchantia polymorpha subsp. ruderalis]
MRGTRRRPTRFAGKVCKGDVNKNWFFSFFIFFFFFFEDPGNAKLTTRGGRQASSPNVSLLLLPSWSGACECEPILLGAMKLGGAAAADADECWVSRIAGCPIDLGLRCLVV